MWLGLGSLIGIYMYMVCRPMNIMRNAHRKTNPHANQQVDGTCKGAGGSMHIYDQAQVQSTTVCLYVCTTNQPSPSNSNSIISSPPLYPFPRPPRTSRAGGRWSRSSCPTRWARRAPSSSTATSTPRGPRSVSVVSVEAFMYRVGVWACTDRLSTHLANSTTTTRVTTA